MRRIGRSLGMSRNDGDRGMAMAIAIVFGMVIVFMVTTVLSVSTSGLRRAAADQDWDAALSAAYAGVQDYQARLANDTSYQRFGNPTAPFSRTSPELTLPTGRQENKAFGVGTSGTWASVPGSDDRAAYRYEVDTSKYLTQGSIRLRSTGKVGSAVRSVVASVRQQGFIDFLYFTDYEIQDPQISGNPASCAVHAWEGRPSGCSEIAFDGGDTIAGPAHSNDTMRICRATFSSSVSTSNPTTGLRYTPKNSLGNSCTGQDFPDPTTQPSFSSSIGMPATNTQQKRETRSDLPDVARPGCLYTGPTNIVFNPDGTMTVQSPATKFTQTKNDDSSGGNNTDQCGQPGTSSGKLGSPGGAVVPVPANNIIYVQNVPAAASDVNSTSERDLGTTCTNNRVGYPLAGEVVPTVGSACAYGSRTGDVFVKGTVKGQVTVAAENFAYVTGDLKYSDSSSDVMGLTASNAVFVWNPVKTSRVQSTCGSGFFSYTCSSDVTTSMLTDSGREIDAAVISVAHTFQVQNYDKGGSRGTLTVKGAIAQKFRGIVRSGDNGYVKDYRYDPRLKYIAPPKFLNPVTTTYGITTTTEVKPSYKKDGSVAG
jgi:Tfp pilus assembly protein PilX